MAGMTDHDDFQADETAPIAAVSPVPALPRQAVPPTIRLAAPVAAPAGWYPLNGELRYWDGLIWTQHTAPAALPVYRPAFQAPVIVTDARTNGVEVAIAWVLTVVTVGYLLPWAIAATRGKSNSWAVGVLNLLLGWTLLGWIVSLVMACTAHRVFVQRY